LQGRSLLNPETLFPPTGSPPRRRLPLAAIVAAGAALVLVASALLWVLQSPLPAVGPLYTGLFAAAAVLAVVFVARWRRARQAGRARDVLFWLENASVVALVLPVLLYLAVVMHTRELAVAEHRAIVERLARTAHEHALKVLETNEVVMGRVDDLVAGMPNAQIQQRAPVLHTSLHRIATGLPQLHAIWVVDENGRVLASSRTEQPEVDLSQRANFRQFQNADTQRLFSAPRQGARTRAMFFELSRKRAAADGSFTGLIVLVLHTEYFRDFYQEVSPAQSGVTHTLLESGGGVLARWPANLAPGDSLSPASPIRRAMADGVPSGSIHSVSTVDGRARLAAYRQVGRYPMYVHAGMDEDVALARWRSDALVLAAFVLPLAVVLSLAMLAALRRTRQNIATAERLQQEYIERGKVEAALHHSQKLEALGHLTGGVAHDFNNLLMVVSMNASILARTAGTNPPPRPLQAIENAVRAGSKLTRQLVAFTRRQPLVPQAVDFAQRLEPDLELLRTLLGGQVQVQAHVAPGTPAVLLDPSELELALINLAINAKHAMPDGGKVTLDARPAADADGSPMVALTFSDTGCGIAPENLQRVFEPFFTTKAVGVGTGLGLSQVQGLCVRAGGRIEIESTQGVGTSVRMLFPAMGAAPRSERQATPPVHAAGDLGADILLVEDNPEVAAATATLLHSLGCRVIHCDQAGKALELLQGGQRFDAVLTDIAMPGGMDGIEFARLAGELEPGLPLLLMTGYAERIAQAEALRLTVLPKPVDAGLLALHLRQMLATPA
jgi:two-component system, NtrC family, sensor kinase